MFSISQVLLGFHLCLSFSLWAEDSDTRLSPKIRRVFDSLQNRNRVDQCSSSWEASERVKELRRRSNEFLELANHIGKTLKADISDKRIEAKRRELHDRMANLKPLLDVFHKPSIVSRRDFGYHEKEHWILALQSLVDNKQDYFMMWPFIAEKSPPNIPNYLGAYYIMRAKIERDDMVQDRLVSRTKSTDGKAEFTHWTLKHKYDYDLTKLSKPELLEKIQNHLNNLDNPNHFILDSFFSGKENQLSGMKFFNNLTHRATPLFLEILNRPDQSISQKELFDIALKIYGDPWTALGMVTFITAYDTAGVHSRERTCLVSRKVVSLDPENKDLAGTLYHFWYYMLRTVYKGSSWRDDLQSWGYEDLLTHDREDRDADEAGLVIGDRINAILKE